jgi:hypothetical protein
MTPAFSIWISGKTGTGCECARRDERVLVR